MSPILRCLSGGEISSPIEGVKPVTAETQTFVCMTCGTQYPPSESAPSSCPICEDDRQYIGHDGQRWITLSELRATHRNGFTEIDPSITAIRTDPIFGIAPHA